MIDSAQYCSENCYLSKVGGELPPPLAINKKCLDCEDYVCEEEHTKCFNCFNENDDEYFYYHSECLKPPKLLSSRYSHDGECLPDSNKCQTGCWRYWCSDCDFGVSGMYSRCSNKDCKRYYQIFTNKGVKCLLCDKEGIIDVCNCFENL